MRNGNSPAPDFPPEVTFPNGVYSRPIQQFLGNRHRPCWADPTSVRLMVALLSLLSVKQPVSLAFFAPPV